MRDSDDRARPLLLAQAAKRDAMEWRYDDVEPVISRLLSDIDRLRQQVEKARAQGRDEGLEEAAKAVGDYPLYLGDVHYRKVLGRAKRIATDIRALKSGEGT